MRLQAFALSLLASTALATPVRRDINHPVYTLRLSSHDDSLDGLYLTTAPKPGNANANATTLGVSTASPAAGPTIKFYAVLDPSTQLSELRTPSTTETALAVVGTNGLLDFASLADPAGAAGSLPEGTTVDWTSFRLDQAEGTVGYGAKGSEGSWVAFPVDGEAWAVKWKGANAWTTDNYLPVQVVFEPVTHE